MMPFAFSGNSIAELSESIAQAIRSGTLSPGDKLPPIREVASKLQLSPATVAGAYRTLQQRGLLVAQGRRGTIVSPRPPLPIAVDAALENQAGVTNCATGNPDRRLLPKLAPALAAVRREQTLYDHPPNHPELVKLGEALFHADRIVTKGLCVVNGSLDGIERALSEVLYPGDPIAVEDPCFTGVLDLVRARGLVPVPVEVDQSGILPKALTTALKRKPKALIVTPRAQNPTGAAFTPSRIQALRKILTTHPDLFVIEDDYVGAISGVTYHGLCDAKRTRWAVVRSLGKSLGPDLRLALLAGDPSTLAHIQGRQVLGVRWVSHLLQDMATYYLQDAKTQGQLQRAEQTYTRRREAFLEALRAWEVKAWGQSGFNVWVPVPEEAQIAQRLLQAGWMVTPGHRYRLETPPAIRVTIASLSEKEVAELAATIGKLLSGQAHSSGGV